MHSISKSICLLTVVVGAAACTDPSSSPSAENACIQQTAEAMVVSTADIAVVSTGPMDAASGVRVLSMRNTRTDRTADCFFNEIDQQVTRVELSGTSSTSPSLTSESACIQQTAEAMVVSTADIAVVSTGPMDAASGVRVLSMRNTRTGRTADCFFNEIDQQVTRVELTSPSPR